MVSQMDNKLIIVRTENKRDEEKRRAREREGEEEGEKGRAEAKRNQVGGKSKFPFAQIPRVMRQLLGQFLKEIRERVAITTCPVPRQILECCSFQPKTEIK